MFRGVQVAEAACMGLKVYHCQENTAWTNHAAKLPDRPSHIVEMLERSLAEDKINTLGRHGREIEIPPANVVQPFRRPPGLHPLQMFAQFSDDRTVATIIFESAEHG